MTGKSLQGEDNSRAGSVGEGGQDGRCDSPMQIDVTDCLEGLMPGEMGHHNKVCKNAVTYIGPPWSLLLTVYRRKLDLPKKIYQGCMELTN